MQPLASAMTKLRKALVSFVHALMRGKSLLCALLAFWIKPSKVDKTARKKPGSSTPREETFDAAALTGPSRSVSPSSPEAATTSRPAPPSSSASRSSSVSTAPTSTSTSPRTIDDFLHEAEKLLLSPVEEHCLRQLSSQLQKQYRERLPDNPICMLPSYNHQLPTGQERGHFVTLDVGGSTLRVALIRLGGRPLKKQTDGQEGLRIASMMSFKITPDIKQLEGMAFFDWMAARIIETLDKVEDQNSPKPDADHPIPIGLAWSFPIEQTSLRGGRLLGMGKGFIASDSLLGQDLGNIIQEACLARGLHVQLATIVNDSTAALLSQAYLHPETRFGLILGTGVNIAVHLPVSTVSRAKFGHRPAAWFDEASHVIINTELGMFGHDILPLTRWDDLLNQGHPKPDFQPLEHLVSGYYLGEIVRFALLEAITTTGIFGGVVPPNLTAPYSLDTETLSMIEGDTSPSLETSIALFQERHPSTVTLTKADLVVLRRLASMASQRSAALTAAAIHGLWALKTETEAEFLSTLPDTKTSTKHALDAQAELAIVGQRTLVAFNGSVMERYPHYREQCQGALDRLMAADGGAVDLVPAEESSLIGAAVSLACMGY